VCRYGLTVKCLPNVIPSSLKDFKGFTSVPSTLMVKVEVSFA
jgi:hypothetical protein